MATYLSGQPTYLPSVQPFQPNLQLFAGSLQMKQSQYDTNRKKISDLYGSLLNSPMTRDTNIEARDEFFKTIDYEIKKLANVDLSLEQNVTQAAGLFNSMYDNKNIVKDILWTKNYNNQMQRAEGFKNCLDPEKCGGQYWEGGVRAMEWRREEFRNASDDDAMTMGDVSYTPYVNVQEMAGKIFKDLDWDVKVDTIDGNWIVTTKNGEQITDDLLVHFQKTIGEDPRVKEYYKTKSYLERKNWGASNAAQYGSQEAAEQEYITQATKMINQSLTKAKESAEHQKTTSKQVANDVKEQVESGEIDDTPEVRSAIDRLFGESEVYGESETAIDGTLSSANNSVATRSLALQGEALDNAMAMLYLNDDLGTAAQVMAYKNYERTLKENPVAMAYQEHIWRMEEAEYKAELDAKKKAKEEEQELSGADILNDFFEGEQRTTGGSDDMAAYRQLVKEGLEEMKSAKTPTSTVLSRTFNLAQQKAKDGGNGAAQAGNDLVSLVDQAIKSFANSAVYGNDANKLRYATNLKKKWDSKSAKEKLGWAKVFDMDKFTKDFSYDAINKVYGVASKMYSPSQENLAKRNYLSAARNELADLIGEADDANYNISQWRETKKAIADSTADYMLTHGGANGKFYKFLINNNGDVRSEQSFAFHAAVNGTTSNKETPTVFIVNSKGQPQHIPVNKFFNNDGYVRPEYQSYSKSWQTGRGGGFWSDYNEAKGVYRGTWVPGEGQVTPSEMPGFWSNAWEYTKGAMTGGMTGGLKGAMEDNIEALKQFEKNVASGKSSFVTEYKKAIRFSIDKMQNEGKDPFKGFGAYTAKDLTGLVDYSAPTSKATMADASFLTNAFKAQGEGDAIFSWGGPKALSQVKHNPQVAEFVHKLMGMALKSADKEGRPTWAGTFNQIGGGREDYQMYTIRLDDPRIANIFGKGTENFEAFYPEFMKSNGVDFNPDKATITVYLKDKAADNIFHKATKMSSKERRLQYRESIPLSFGANDDIHKLTLYKDGSAGGYIVKGSLATGYNDDGSYNFKPVVFPYEGGYSPDMISSELSSMVSDIRKGLNSLK